MRAGKLDDDAAMAALARVRFVTDIGELADRQLVVEAVREFEDEKLEVFRSLGKIVIDERRDPGVEHVVDPDHEAGRRQRAPRARGRACTSSTRCR